MKEEIFGPILPIIEYDNVSEVIDTIKRGQHGLTVYYYGNTNTDAYSRLLNETHSGSLVANEQGLSFVSFTTGFGGVGYSG